MHADAAKVGQFDALAFAANDALALGSAEGGSVVGAVGPGKFVVAVVVLPGLDRGAQRIDGIFGGVLAGVIQRRMLRRPGILPHGEEHADGARLAGIESLLEIRQCPVVGLAGAGGALLEQGQLLWETDSGRSRGCESWEGSLVQVVKVGRERARRLLRYACGEFLGIGMVLEGFGNLPVLPGSAIRYVGKE